MSLDIFYSKIISNLSILIWSINLILVVFENQRPVFLNSLIGNFLIWNTPYIFTPKYSLHSPFISLDKTNVFSLDRLKTKKNSAKWVTKCLSVDQKCTRLDVSLDLCLGLKNASWFSKAWDISCKNIYCNSSCFNYLE